MRIIFMGTPDFAVESLKILVENKYDVVGVITMPDKPAGRGHKLQCSPVKQFALDHGLRLLQPEKLKDESFLDELQSLKADLQIVVAFRMLPEVVWNMPKFGTFNLHASLLPQYRGAAPINWAIINGQKETGITTFFLNQSIDTGDIIESRKVRIFDSDNAGSLHDKLMIMGAELVLKTVNLIEKNNISPKPQRFIKSKHKPAPKIFKETCQIDLSWNVENVNNFVRGLSPYPVAWVALKFPGQEEKTILKVYETEKELCDHDFRVGTVVTDGKKYAKVALFDGFIHLKSVQIAGKKRMEIGELLRGMRF